MAKEGKEMSWEKDDFSEQAQKYAETQFFAENTTATAQEAWKTFFQENEQKEKEKHLARELALLETAPRMTLAKVMALILTVLLLIIAGQIFVQQQEEFRRVAVRQEEVEQQALEVIQESLDIEAQYRDIESVEQLEKISRENLGFVRAGDIVFQEE